MGIKEIIYQTSNGLITLNRAGERIVENYTFYAAFVAPREWTVVCKGQKIGQISNESLMYLKVGSHFLLAGSRWEIEEFKNRNYVIIVKPALNTKPLTFSGNSQNIHRAIHQKMHTIYDTNFIPKYLSSSSIDILQSGYDTYNAYVKPLDSNLLTILEGTTVQNTIKLILKFLNIEFQDAGIGCFYDKGKVKLIKALKSIDITKFDLNFILNTLEREHKYKKKFDELLPLDILNKSCVLQCLDFPRTIEFIKNL